MRLWPVCVCSIALLLSACADVPTSTPGEVASGEIAVMAVDTSSPPQASASTSAPTSAPARPAVVFVPPPPPAPPRPPVMPPASGPWHPPLLFPAPLGSLPAQDISYNSRIQPKYPAEAIRNRWQGTVLLLVLVEHDGAPAGVWIERSSGFAVLDATAQSTAAQWRFRAARRQGVQVPAYVRVPVNFALHYADPPIAASMVPASN